MEVNKDHVYCQTPGGFSQSAYLQERVVLLGQASAFAEAEVLLKALTGLAVNAKQIERLTHHYGQLWQENQQAQADEHRPKENTLHYGMMDGSMVLTRKQGWKEIKLARVFAGSAVLPQTKERHLIRQSTYIAHLGGQEAFFEKLSPQVDYLTNLVWIADGARWIWDWIEQYYPDSEQILDYYHAKERLCAFALEAFPDRLVGKDWIDQQEALLLEDQVETVLASIALMSLKGKAGDLQKSICTYYRNNLQRMRYKTFRQKGLLIGSGPMEAAHRHVIQQRLKRSGQRWSIAGAQQVANLRVANASSLWHTVRELIISS